MTAGAAIFDFIVQHLSALLFLVMLIWNISLHRAGARKSELETLRNQIDSSARKSELEMLRNEVAALELKHFQERDKTREKFNAFDLVLKVVPGSQAVHDLQLELARMAGDVNVMAATVTMMKKTTDRIDHYLMKEGAQ